MTHGNDTENSSFLDVCFALKNNVFRTLNVADICVIREIDGEVLRVSTSQIATQTLSVSSCKASTLK